MRPILFTLVDVNIPTHFTWVGLGMLIMFIFQSVNYLWNIIKARDKKRDEMTVMQVKIDDHDKELKGIHDKVDKIYNRLESIDNKLGIGEVDKVKTETSVRYEMKGLIEKYAELVIKQQHFENRIEEIVTGNENRIKELEKIWYNTINVNILKNSTNDT